MNEIRLTEGDLQKLTTVRLLKYLHSLLECPDDHNWDGCHRLTKASDKWREHYALVKSILATREHIDHAVSITKHKS